MSAGVQPGNAPRTATVLAFDFGASSGRAILAAYKDGALTCREVHRFENSPRMADGHFCWDIRTLLAEVKNGIAKAGEFDSLGFDTWGVDFGLLDAQGNLLGDPVHYRDARTEGMVAEALAKMDANELYKETGNQIMSLNTLFQLLALQKQDPAQLAKDLKVGDKVVSCMIFKDNPDITMFDLNKQNVGGADVYGLLPDDDIHLNGWFSDYILIRGGSTIFNVSDLDLYSRILIEPCAVLIHAVERAKTTGILRFNSRVVVQGCGPIGLICIAILHTMGIANITAVDGEQKRLDFAKDLGATQTVNFKDHKGLEALTAAVEASFGGHPADFGFQCTGSPMAHANIYKFIRNGGGLCELGFFINGGDATINPHFDICAKEITLVGSWVYTLRDYATTFDFLKSAKKIGLPMDKLITHTFPLTEINEAHKTNLAMAGLKIAILNK